VQQFIQYFIRDVIGSPYSFTTFKITWISIPNEQSATALFSVVSLVGACISSLISGYLSDRFGRKWLVYASGIIEGVSVLLFTLPWLQTFDFTILIGFFFGMGYGAFLAVDWALATDILPSTQDFGKDMGIWHMAWGVPQIVAPILSGILLDTFRHIGASLLNYPSLGYSVIFGLSLVWFMLCLVIVSNIKFDINRRGQALDTFFHDVDVTLLKRGDVNNDGEEVGEEEDDEDGWRRYVTGPTKKGKREKSDHTINIVRPPTSHSAIEQFVEGQLDVEDLSFGSDQSDSE